MTKTVAISAGASGIGRAIAESFIADGMNVFVCDVDTAAVADFKAKNPKAFAMTTDVRDTDAIQSFFDLIKKETGRLDILINNAGIAGPTAKIEDIAIDAWRDTIDIDLNSFFYFSRLAIPMVRNAGGGSIVNIASNAAFFGFPMRSAYAVSKWGIIGLTKTMAMELGEDDIRVNAICPGSVEGDRINRVIAKDAEARNLSIEDVRREYQSQSSLKTFVTKDDIVAMVQFLTGPTGRRISGQAIGLDGHTEGLSLHNLKGI
ncbi:SDR family oxidoreductase [Kordiimonas sp.]|uniref:SDR family oxidoreductase n=1 Tax=Kordiimonas sp. TaxID=1970157 RepID=UPI003A8FC8F3